MAFGDIVQSAENSGFTSSLSVGLGATPIDGNLVLMILGQVADTDPTAEPWTADEYRDQGGLTEAWIYHKIASSEPSSYSWTFSTSRYAAAVMVEVEGPFDAADLPHKYSETGAQTGTDVLFNAVTTTVGGCFVAALASMGGSPAANNSFDSWGAGFTEEIENPSDGELARSAIAWDLQGSAGTVDTSAVTSPAIAHNAFLIAFAPDTSDTTLVGASAFTPTLSFPAGDAVGHVAVTGGPYTPTLLWPKGQVSGGTPPSPTAGLYGPGLMAAKGRPAVHAVGFSSFKSSFIVRFESSIRLAGTTTLTPALSFPVGNVAFDVVLSSTASYKPALNFPQGLTTLASLLSGSATFAPGLTFPTGSAIEHIQGSDPFAPSLSFPAGTVGPAVPQSLLGTIFRPTLSFPTGLATGGSDDLLRGGGWRRRGPHPGKGHSGVRTSRLS
jgi:hypothetical protein